MATDLVFCANRTNDLIANLANLVSLLVGSNLALADALQQLPSQRVSVQFGFGDKATAMVLMFHPTKYRSERISILSPPELSWQVLLRLRVPLGAPNQVL